MALRRNEKIGLILIALPPLLIVGSMILFALSAALFTNLQGFSTIGIIVNYILSFAGFIGMIGIFVFIPIGIYFLCKKESKK